MEKLCNLFFELSNEDRLTMLTLLGEEPMKLTQLSQRLKYRPQEAARNVSRLSKARLIGRDSDGYKFLSEHSEYFSTHTLRDIPGEFTDRIGALVNVEQPREVMSTLTSVEEMMAEAEEYVLVIADSVLISYLSLELDSAMRGVMNRSIVPRGIQLPPEVWAESRREEAVLAATGMCKFLEGRVADRVDVYLMMSEKEVAGITFKTLNGSFDHLHFSGSDSRFHGWCKDLFEYYWVRSRLS